MFNIDAFKPDSDKLEKLAQFMTRTSGFFDVQLPPNDLIQPLGELVGFNLAESTAKILELLDKDLQDSVIPAGLLPKLLSNLSINLLIQF